MKYVCATAIALCLSALAPSPVFGQIEASYLSIPPTQTSYLLVSSQRVTRSQFYYTYQAVLVNTGPALPAVTATATSLVPNVSLVPGQGSIHFSPVPANSQVTSIDTFTILVNSFSFVPSDLQWSFLNPVAKPGPNQTAAVNSTVTLNGSGSTTGAGVGALKVGSLTYSWTLTSVPPGSMAELSNANTIIATFVPDLAGTYIARLTVTDGFGSDSATVTISTENSAPVANAGPNQTVALGSTVQLNGSQSFDADGDPLRYSWSFVSLPPASSAILSNPRGVTTTFTADVPGTYIAQLVVNDATLSSQPSTVTVTTGNTAPVANAGPNQRVNVGALVQLNGAGSTDVNGNPLTYLWTLNTTQAPGSKATLSNPTSISPTFTADVPGIYVGQLIVNDGIVNSQPATVTISTNAVLAPTANAGANQSVAPGATVQLNGSGSTDPQGLPLTYTWSLITLPANSSAVLSAGNIVNPTFVADQSGTYVAQLTVSNGYLSSTVPATVTIATTDVQPVANAGPAQTVIAGSAVTLDGSQSSDPNNQPLTYSWALLSVPAGSNAVLTGQATVNPTFVADVTGAYVVQLIVSDSYASSSPSTVTITATKPTITLSPNSLNLSNSPAILTLTLNPPASANSPVVVSLSGFNSAVISAPNFVTVSAGSVNVTVTPIAMGTTEVLASASGYQSATASVMVTTPSISIALSNSTPAVGLTHTVNGTVTLSSPAPAGGTIVALSADPSATGQVSFNPSSVTILQGSTVGTFSLTGVALGSTTITASSSGYNNGTATVLVVALGGIAFPQGSSLTVAFGQSVPLNVQLSTPAPVGGTTISLSSTNPSILIVTPTVFIPQGSTTPIVAPLVFGAAVGSASITASSGGYTGNSVNVSVLAAISLLPQTISEVVGASQSVIVLLSAPPPASGLVVNFSSSNTNVAAVTSSVTITGQSAVVQVTGVGPGVATVTASTTSPFFAVAGAGVSVTVTTGP